MMNSHIDVLLARIFLVIGLLGFGFSSACIAADIFVYARSDGSRLITDHPRTEPGYSLIKVYRDEFTDADIMPVPAVRAKLSATEYDQLINRISRQVFLDPALIKSVMHAESGFDPSAISRKGASGLMQLMPATADRYGVTQIFNPQQNVMAGSRYLSDLLGQFQGDMRLALAGYNAGENAVLRHGGVPPYQETQRYVKKVMALYKSYRNQNCESAPENSTIVSCTDTNVGAYTSWSTQ